MSFKFPSRIFLFSNTTSTGEWHYVTEKQLFYFESPQITESLNILSRNRTLIIYRNIFVV